MMRILIHNTGNTDTSLIPPSLTSLARMSCCFCWRNWRSSRAILSLWLSANRFIAVSWDSLRRSTKARSRSTCSRSSCSFRILHGQILIVSWDSLSRSTKARSRSTCSRSSCSFRILHGQILIVSWDSLRRSTKARSRSSCSFRILRVQIIIVRFFDYLGKCD
jgi:hypothetical protein